MVAISYLEYIISISSEDIQTYIFLLKRKKKMILANKNKNYT